MPRAGAATARRAPFIRPMAYRMSPKRRLPSRMAGVFVYWISHVGDAWIPILFSMRRILTVASPTCEIQYTNTPAILLGKRRFGLMRYAMGLMNGARLAVAAQALGIAEAAYREADQYSRERIQFGKPIRSLPAVGRLLLAMKVDLEASRALLAETASWVDLWKVHEKAIGEGTAPNLDALRARYKQCQTLAETLTPMVKYCACLLYTSDAADEEDSVDLGGRRIIK